MSRQRFKRISVTIFTQRVPEETPSEEGRQEHLCIKTLYSHQGGLFWSQQRQKDSFGTHYVLELFS